MLYAVIMLVPLLGWAGHLGFRRARDILRAIRCRRSGRRARATTNLLLQWHAYFAFGLLALVALHIGVAIHDYMTGVRRAAD